MVCLTGNLNITAPIHRTMDHLTAALVMLTSVSIISTVIAIVVAAIGRKATGIKLFSKHFSSYPMT